MDSDFNARIQQRAYQIWEQENRPEGRQLEHWCRAEWELATAAPDPLAPAEATAADAQDQAMGGLPAAAPRAATKAERSAA